MPIDPSIALQYKGVQFPDPVNALMKQAQLQSAMQAQQLNALRMQQAQKQAGQADIKSRMDQYTQALGRAANKQQAAEITKSMFADPVVGPHVGRVGTADQAIADIPDDPSQFGDWKLGVSGATPLQMETLKVQREKLNRLAPKVPSMIQTMEALGYPPTKEGLEQFRSAGKTSPQTTIVMPRIQTAEESAKGKANVEQYKVISQTAASAAKNLPALETQSRILDKGFETGYGADAAKAGAAILARLGFENAEEYAKNAQTFLAATQQSVLQKQLEQKGAQTERDAQRISQTGAQLGNTPEANRFLIAVAKAQIKRDIEQRDFWDNYWNKNKTYEGVENAWYSGAGSKSLFDSPELKKYQTPAAPAANQPKSGVIDFGSLED